MWADAQRDGRPAEYRWRPLQKLRDSIPCTMAQSLADARCYGVPCSNAANIGERKTWTYKVNFALGNSVCGQNPQKCIQCTSAGDGQTFCKVWLAAGELATLLQ